MTESEGVALYIQVRDRRSDRKAAFKIEDDKDAAIQAKLEALFLQKFQESGTDSLTVRGVGTAFTQRRTSVSSADKEAFLDFIKTNDEWGLLDARPLKSAIESYKEAHGELPPGLNWSEEIVVNVRRS